VTGFACRAAPCTAWSRSDRGSRVSPSTVRLEADMSRPEAPAFTLEIIPLKSVTDQFRFLEPGERVAVTASPGQGQDTTIDVAVDLAQRGFEPIPHLSARLLRDRGHLHDVVTRLSNERISRAFVVGGDGEATGIYSDGLALLEELHSLPNGPSQIGIPGYPEGHPKIPTAGLMDSLLEKQRFAHYVTTQMCFDPAVIADWIREIRAAGVVLPIHVGIPGATSLSRLLSVSVKIGVGTSVRFLAKHSGVGNLVRRGSYVPDRLLADLGPTFRDPLCGVRRVHLYTFNQVDSTQRWRRAVEARDERSAAETEREMRA